MNKSVFKAEVSSAVKQIASKHGVQVKVSAITQVKDHMESVLVIDPKNNNSRSAQVKALYDKGLTSAKVIAEKIGSHPSYISNLLSKVRKHEVAV